MINISKKFKEKLDKVFKKFEAQSSKFEKNKVRINFVIRNELQT